MPLLRFTVAVQTCTVGLHYRTHARLPRLLPVALVTGLRLFEHRITLHPPLPVTFTATHTPTPVAHAAAGRVGWTDLPRVLPRLPLQLPAAVACGSRITVPTRLDALNARTCRACRISPHRATVALVTYTYTLTHYLPLAARYRFATPPLHVILVITRLVVRGLTRTIYWGLLHCCPTAFPPLLHHLNCVVADMADAFLVYVLHLAVSTTCLTVTFSTTRTRHGYLLPTWSRTRTRSAVAALDLTPGYLCLTTGCPACGYVLPVSSGLPLVTRYRAPPPPQVTGAVALRLRALVLPDLYSCCAVYAPRCATTLVRITDLRFVTVHPYVGLVCCSLCGTAVTPPCRHPDTRTHSCFCRTLRVYTATGYPHGCRVAAHYLPAAPCRGYRAFIRCCLVWLPRTPATTHTRTHAAHAVFPCRRLPVQLRAARTRCLRMPVPVYPLRAVYARGLFCLLVIPRCRYVIWFSCQRYRIAVYGCRATRTVYRRYAALLQFCPRCCC